MDRSPLAADPYLHGSIIDSLYAEALVLADEARAWFDRARGDADGRPGAAIDLGSCAGDVDGGLFHWAGRHDPTLRIALACESLRLTTRLMHVIAWLLMQRAVAAGEVAADVVRLDANRLGPSPPCDAVLRDALPAAAVALIDGSERLHARVALLEAGMLSAGAAHAPPAVHRMLDRLAAAL